ncbi:DUF4034 domain-containing protein [Glycomyces sp. NPDC047010]|uniref:DUF4034 domain-containing protein n=1 Tax=Glycomyces sp. NPDC047010 TaxID=3155023 RepID=UPI0033EA5F23
MALLLKAKTRVLMAMRKEAKRRGQSLSAYMETVSQSEIIALIQATDPTVNPADVIPGLPDVPPVDVTGWGMPPMAALSTEVGAAVPAIAAAVAAARAGDWRPAADLLHRSYGDWPMRAAAVHALGEAAADDGTWLQAWRAAGGEERHLAVLDAHGMFWLAWKLRGNLPPEETAPDQHDAFYRTVARTEAAAQHAVQAAPEDPTPWFTLVVLARARGYDAGAFNGIWAELQARDPLHRAGHEFALMYWSPEGNGSYDPLFAFAERAAAAHPSLAFLTVAAAYDYEDVDEHVWKDARVQRALDAVLRHLATREGATGPYANADRGWAAYGLVNSGRGAEAIPLFTQLATDASARPWQDFGPDARTVFDAFRRRACAAA